MEREYAGNIVLPDRVLYGGAVRCVGERIAEIVPGKVKDTEGLPYIFPGLVDIHNHGAMGHDYMEGTAEAFGSIAGYLARHGVTTAQCTTVSAPLEQVKSFLDSYRRWQKGNTGNGCRFCGVHIEGPYISPGKRGAHPKDALLIPRDGYDWVLDNRDIIHEITIAPELPGMMEMIEDLYKAGIVVSGGHDDAEPEEIEIAMEKGMSHCTHIYCAMSTLHKTGLQRRCGLCEYAMTHDDITAEMIADNHHIPPQLAQMIYKCKGADKLCLVSDAIAPAGMEGKGMFCLGTGEDCTRVFVEDDVAVVEDRSCYAGSVQSLDRMIRNLVKEAGIPLVDAVRMASLTPAEIIHMDGECGSIKAGKRADLCIVDSRLHVVQTVIGGTVVYQREDR